MTGNSAAFIEKITAVRRFRVNISFTLNYHWFFILPFIAYAIWEIYWAGKIGYGCIKWHTHLAPYIYLWILGYLLLYYLVRPGNSALYIKYIVKFTSIVGSFLFVELLLVTFNIEQTTNEKLGLGYRSLYDATGESWYHTYPSNREHWLKKKEYSYRRISNSLGFSDVAWPVKKKVDEKRILALGDSFTEGDGAPYDSSYVFLLRNKFHAIDSTVYVMNAGTCGCDPFINFINFRDRLSIYYPDVIVQTLSSGDMNVDIILRGGLERFKAGGTVQYRNGPWWEPLYAISNLVRLCFSAFGYNELLMSKAYIDGCKTELNKKVIELFKQYAMLAGRNGCRLLVVLQPFLREVNDEKYDYDFSSITSELKMISNIRVFDLMPFYRSYAKAQNKPMACYYWRLDGHHNSNGYAMMAEGIYPVVADELIR